MKRHPVLVTGCSSGIGKATAQTLVEAGYTVYATARRPSALADLEVAGARTLPLDVTDEVVRALRCPADAITRLGHGGEELPTGRGVVASFDLRHRQHRPC